VAARPNSTEIDPGHQEASHGTVLFGDDRDTDSGIAERLVELAPVIGAAVAAGFMAVDAYHRVEVVSGQRAHRDAIARQGFGIVLAGVAVVGLGVELVQQLLGGGMRTRGHR